MSIHKLYFLGFALLLISACSSDLFLVHTGNMPAEDKVAQLHKGQTEDEVAALLGTPSSVVALDDHKWVYMSSTVKKVAFFKPEEIERDVLTITFNKNGRVEEITTYDKDSGKQVAIDTSKTPTAGSEEGFFRKYFGGVGAYMPIAPTTTNDGL